jgi:nucleoside-diphosphate-sugar epimerase
MKQPNLIERRRIYNPEEFTQKMKFTAIGLGTKIPNGGGGWKGTVKNMLLDISKIKTLGWKPKHNIRQAMRKATRQAITESSSN